MKKVIFFMMLSVASLFAKAQVNVRYVSETGSGSKTGLSWKDASDDLQLMMMQLGSLPQLGEIYVSAGTYRPIRPADNLSVIDSLNPDNAFVMQQDVFVYGGFSATDTTLARNWKNNPTILEGRLAEGMYCNHIVMAIGNLGLSLLEGFIVQVAADNFPGVYFPLPPYIISVNGYSIINEWGSGIIVYASDASFSSLIIRNTIYEGMYIRNANPIISNTLIHSNMRGGVKCVNSEAEFYGVTITKNRINNGSGGQGMLNQNSSPHIYNSIIYGNVSFPIANQPEVKNENGSSPEYHYCLVHGETVKDGNGNLNGYLNPFFTNPDANDFTLSPYSICVDKGNYHQMLNIPFDLEYNQRIFGSDLDIGAYECQVPKPVMQIMYVNKNVVGGDNSGSSWQNAIPDLSNALQLARMVDGLEQIWVAQGTYNPGQILLMPEDYAITDPRDRGFVLADGIQLYGGFVGNETQLEERNWITHPTILDGNNAYHTIIAAYCSDTVCIDGFTITGGKSDTATARNIDGQLVSHNYGGGLALYHSNIKLKNVVIKKNVAINAGGGLYADASSIVLEEVRIDSNAVTNNTNIEIMGGGMYCRNSFAFMNEVDICNNTALNSYYKGQGGGLYADASTIRGKLVNAFKNQADEGGGIYTTRASSIMGMNIFQNTAYSGGGGVYNYVDAISTTPVLESIAIVENFADNGGGGIYNFFKTNDKSISFVNLSICKNYHQGQKEGIFNGAPPGISYTMNVYNSVMVENYVPILSNNNYYHSYYDSANLLSVYNNLAMDINPSFVDPVNGNYQLNFDSELIDRGEKLYMSTSNMYDAAGIQRILGLQVDIGAYEARLSPDASGRIYVNQQVANNGGDGSSWSTALKELATALRLANGDSTISEIWVAQGMYKPLYKASYATTSGDPTTDRHKSFVVMDGISLYGGFNGTETDINQRNWKDNPTILSGNIGDPNSNADNCYHVVVHSDLGLAPSYMSGVIIEGGNANSTTEHIFVNNELVESNCGGGVYNRISYNSQSWGYGLSLDHVIIRSNYAMSGGGIFNKGGDIYTDSFSAFSDNVSTVSNSLIHSNIGMSGGGIYNGYNTNFGLKYSTVVYNEASTGSGIYDGFQVHLLMLASIVQFNTGTPNYFNFYTFTTDVSFSLVGDYTFEGPDTTIGSRRTAFNLDGKLDPLFVDTVNHDYRLQKSSPCVNRGGSLDSVYTHLGLDLACKPRVCDTLPDVGAYENQGLSPNTAGVLFIKETGAGLRDGSSWADAFDNFAIATKTAAVDISIHQIWVADGVYYPTTTTDRNIPFTLPENVLIYGGFPANADDVNHTSIADRTPVSAYGNGTILSGNIGDPNDMSDNSVQVVYAGANTHLDGFYVEEGNAYLNLGVGICVNGNATLRNLTVRNNSGGVGSGVAILGGNPLLEDMYIHSNQAISVGGGAYVSNSSPVFSNVELFDNSTPMGGSGGGVYNTSASPIFNGVSIHGNSCRFGGGMYNVASSPVLTDVSIYQNTGSEGGGICNEYNSFPVFTNTSIFENDGSYGGGFYNRESSFELTGVSIQRNYARSGGGGIYNENSPLDVFNVLITNNKCAINGGAIYQNNTSIYDTCRLINVLFANDTADYYGGVAYIANGICEMINVTASRNYDGMSTMQGVTCNGTLNIFNSILSGNTTSATSNNNINYYHSLIEGVTIAGTNNNLSGSTNPLFVDPANGDFQLDGTSPCRNAGNNTYINNVQKANEPDLAGNNRIYDNIIDMGAYENQENTIIISNPDINGILYVRKGSVGDGSSWSNALGELSDAITAANTSNSIQEIWVSSATYYPTPYPTSTTDRTKSLVLPANVKIFGGFPPTLNPAWTDRNWVTYPTILSGDIGVANVMTDNSFTVVKAGNYSHLDGFFITGGYGASLGSGILVSGSADLRNLRVYQNYADQAGGIAITGGSPSLSHSVIYLNTAQFEGGGMGIFSGTPSIDSLVIQSNSAQSGGGLAILSGTPYIDSLAISDNNAQTNGGGVAVFDGMPHFKRIHIHGNQAQSGGGLAVLGGCADIEVAYIYSNHANYQGGGILIESQGMRGGTTIGNEREHSTAQDTSLFVEDEGGNTRDPAKPQTRLFAKYINIFGNQTDNRGGGIACVSYPFTPIIMPVFENCAIHENHSMGEAGGVFNDNSGLLFLNPLFYDNNSVGPGTEIYEQGTSSYTILVHATITKTNLPSTISDIVITQGDFYLYHSLVCLNGFSPPPFAGDNYIVNGSCSNLFVEDTVGNYSLVPHVLFPIRPFDLSMVINNIYPYGFPPQLFCDRTGELLETDMDGNPRITNGMSNYGAYEVDSNFTRWNPFWKSANNAEDKEEEEDLLQKGSGWKLQAYPNPIPGGQQITVSLSNSSSYYNHSVQLQLLSTVGSILLSETYPIGKFTMNVPQLAQGLYIIRVQTEEGAVYTGKLVVW